MKLTPLVILIGAFSFAHAQTCVGIFTMKLFDQKIKKPVTGKLTKNIQYVFTKDEAVFYDDVEAVQPIDSLIKQEDAFTIRKNEKGYNFFNNPEDESLLTFPSLCGLYLVQMDFIRKEDTMSLGIYNIPAHQSFQMDTLFFQEGDFYIDIQASKILNEMEFLDNKGYFIVPRGMMQPFVKKKD